MVFSKGPIVLLRLELGVLSKGRLTILEIMNEYLKQSQLHQVLHVLSAVVITCNVTLLGIRTGAVHELEHFAT